MIKIIPAVNTADFEEIKKKIKLIEPYTDWVQIDVADGTFTKNTLWHNPQELALIETSLNIEAHLMISNIERRVEEWLSPNVKRIIFHISASADPDFVIKKIKEAGKEAGIAIGQKESLTEAMRYKNKINFFQILGVYPGLPGQQIIKETFDRIKELRKFCPSCIIEVDGGMNKETGKRAVEAGANIIVAANAIFNGDVKKNIEELNGSLN